MDTRSGSLRLVPLLAVLTAVLTDLAPKRRRKVMAGYSNRVHHDGMSLYMANVEPQSST